MVVENLLVVEVPVSFDRKAWRIKRRLELKEKGICPICMTRPLEEGYKTCKHCRELHKETLKRRVIRSRELGVCISCHKNKVKEGCVMCQVCIDKSVRSARLRKYNMTEGELDTLFRNPRCAICGSYTNLHIDHDHNTGRVRGLLCSSCNRGLGCFVDNIEYLLQAVAYLKN